MAKAGEKRKYPTRDCGDCGMPMKVAAKNQVRCAVCSLGKAAAWFDGRVSTCSICDAEYLAWRGKTDATCGRCFMLRSPMGNRDAVEAVCGHAALGTCHSLTAEQADAGGTCWVFDPRLKLCLPCLYDPTKFKGNRDAVLRRYGELTSRTK